MLRQTLPRHRILLVILALVVSGLGIAAVDTAAAQSQQPTGLIAYVVTAQDGTGQIWRMNADGSGKMQLTNDAGALNYFPNWSPDGQQIVFISRSLDGSTEHLQLMDADGGNRLTLETIERLDANGEVVRFFATTNTFSPDNRRLIYVIYTYATKTSLADTRMMLINRDGNARRQIPQGAQYDGNQVYWMADNRLIIGAPDGIHTLSLVDGTDVLIADDLAWFALSPDETRLALLHMTDPDGLALETLSLSGSARQPIIAFGQLQRTIAVQYPVSWSPDGEWIGIGVLYEPEAKPPAPDPGDPLPFQTQDGFYVFAPDEAGAFRLASDPYASWSPDGAFVVYSETQQPNDVCSSVIFVQSTEGDSPIAVSEPGCNFQPVWGADSQ